VGGLEPSPEGRLRRATIRHLSRSTASRSSAYIKPPSALGTHRNRNLPARSPRSTNRFRACGQPMLHPGWRSRPGRGRTGSRPRSRRRRTSGAAARCRPRTRYPRFFSSPHRRRPARHHGSHARLRAPGERGNAQLKTWRILRKLRCCPHHAGHPAKAIHVLQTREATG
jgi:hypothetical protein